VAQVSESRNQILLILKGCILEYRLYLNPFPSWIQAIIDIVTFVLQSPWTALEVFLNLLSHTIKVLAVKIGLKFIAMIDKTITNAGMVAMVLGSALTVVGAILIPVGGIGLIAGGSALIVAGASIGVIGAMEFRRHNRHSDSPIQINSRLILSHARAWLEAQL